MKYPIYFVCMAVFFSSIIYAENNNLYDGNDNLLHFQIIQAQIQLDSNNVKNASLIEENGVFKGLEIELKEKAIPAFTQMTQDGVGKTLNLVLNEKIISASLIATPLGGKILVTGITKGEAYTFLNGLREHLRKLSNPNPNVAVIEQ